MFALFSQLFWSFLKFGFFQKWGDKPYTKAVKQDISVSFSKVQQSNNFLKEPGYLTKT